jgi:hypothetical protein
MNAIKGQNLHNSLATALFYGIMLVLLWPVVSLSFILTHDGPAHLYNSCLIRELISGNQLVSEFLLLKKFPEPNWIGHFLLADLSLLFSPRLAEKIFLGAYVILFPLFFRKTLRLVNTNNYAAILLIFPFVYSYFFIGGLYNFLAGVVVLFAALNVILPGFAKKGNKKYLHIFLFSLLLYFSHLIALGVFLVMIFLAHIFLWKESIQNGNFNLKILFRTSIPVIISLFPALILLAVFFSDKLFMQTNSSAVTLSEMFNALLYISPIVTLQADPENYYSVVIVCLLIFLLASGIILWRMKIPVTTNSNIAFYQKPSFWLIASLIMFVLFLVVPDQAASGGAVKFRFELIFFLFLIVFINTLPMKGKLNLGVSLLITGWVLLKMIYLFPKMKNLDADVKTAMECTKHIKENSILLPLNYSPNWMHCNLFNYAGTEKNIFVLDNYEAGMPHFPLEWKKGRNPVAIMGDFNIDPPPLCADVSAFENQTGHNVEYIVVWKYQPLTDTCTTSIQSLISKNYSLIYENADILKLYKRN